MSTPLMRTLPAEGVARCGRQGQNEAARNSVCGRQGGNGMEDWRMGVYFTVTILALMWAVT